MLYANYKTVYEQDIDLPSGKSWNQGEMITRINCNWDAVYYDPDGKGYGDDTVLSHRVYDNSVTVARILLEARATRYNTKHIDVEPRDMSRLSKLSAIAEKRALLAWGRKHGLAKLLRDITDTRPKYGGVLVKKTKEDVHVVQWENVITDQTDILKNPILERHYMLPSEVLAMTAWKNTRDAVKDSATGTRDASTADHQGHDYNQSAGRQMEVWELTGEITLNELKEAQEKMGNDVEYNEDDEHTYVFARIIECGSHTLYAEQVEGAMEDYYRYLPRNEQSGRALGQSVYEQLADHQTWHNFTKTEEMRMLAVVGKLSSMLHTDDAEMYSQLTNVMSSKLTHGNIILHRQGTQLGQINVAPSTLPVYQAVRAEWDSGSNDKTSSYASVTGAEQKAGTPFRAQMLQNQMGSTQFTDYRDEIGTEFILPILNDWIAPMALKEAEEDMFDTFSADELAFIDSAYTTEKQREMFIEKTLNGERVTQEDMFAVQLGVEMELAKMGTRRKVENVGKFLKQAHGRVILSVNDEERSKAEMFESFANVLQYLQPGDPRYEAIIDRIMSAHNFSDEELRMYETKSKEAMQAPQAPQARAPQAPQPSQQALPALPITQ